jgi:hypothetical protein
MINFNKKYPENHNFCNTSLEGDYVKLLNKDSGKVESVNKEEFYDKVLLNSVSKLNEIVFSFEFANIYNRENIKEKYRIPLEKVVVDPNIYNKNNKKIYSKNINQISYNNKDMVLDTWSNLKFIEDSNDYSSDSDTSITDSNTSN